MNDPLPATPKRRLQPDNRLPNPALLLLLKRPHSGPEIVAAMRAQGLRLTPEQLHAHIEAGFVSFAGKGNFLVFCLPGDEKDARALRSKTLAGGRVARDRKAEQACEGTRTESAPVVPAPTQHETSPTKANPEVAPAPALDPEPLKSPDALRSALARFEAELAATVKEATGVETRRAEMLMRARALEEVLGVMQSKMLRLALARDRVQAILDQSAPPPMCMDDFVRVHLAPKLSPKAPDVPATGGASSKKATTNKAPCEPEQAQTQDPPEKPTRAPLDIAAPMDAPTPQKPTPSAKPATTPRQEPSAPRREQPAQRSSTDCVELSREMLTPDGKKCIVTFTQSREGCTVLRPSVFVDWLDRNGHPNGEKIPGRLAGLWNRFCADEPDALARIHAPTRSPVR